MKEDNPRFASLTDAIAALQAVLRPTLLTRFERIAADRVVIAANAAAAADKVAPTVGERPDARRDRNVTADIELDYLYQKLVADGHARQVVSVGGRYRELTITRVYIEGDDDAVYGFVSPRTRTP